MRISDWCSDVCSSDLDHAVVSYALLAEQELEIAYRAIGGTQSRSHRIHPLGLVLEGNVLYLVASFYDYDEPRQLAMHRIEKAARLEARCEAPAGFSLARFVDEGGFGCGGDTLIRSEDRRVGRECVSTCRVRGARDP